MSLYLEAPQQLVDSLVEFIRETFARARKTKAVVAVSGGIDSAVALTLTARALSPEQLIPVFLPYQHQAMQDAQAICEFCQIDQAQWHRYQIDTLVEALSVMRPDIHGSQVRLGNAMARSRMMVVFDLAKAHDALVIGTENKSEQYLGYFTRFGDAASDLEPINTLYKTQVRQLATFLKLPEQFTSKAPSAGLWAGQTDEQELGFSYDDADQVLYQLVEERRVPSAATLPGISPAVIEAVLSTVERMAFKQEVPYTFVTASENKV